MARRGGGNRNTARDEENEFQSGFQLMNARQVECISFESLEVDSVKDLVMGSILQ